VSDSNVSDADVSDANVPNTDDAPIALEEGPSTSDDSMGADHPGIVVRLSDGITPPVVEGEGLIPQDDTNQVLDAALEVMNDIIEQDVADADAPSLTSQARTDLELPSLLGGEINNDTGTNTAGDEVEHPVVNGNQGLHDSMDEEDRTIMARLGHAWRHVATVRDWVSRHPTIRAVWEYGVRIKTGFELLIMGKN